MRLVWRAEARRDARRIIDYIDERNPAAAERMRQRFEFADRLVDFSYLRRPGRVSGTREAIVHPNYIMIYKVVLDTI